MALDRRSDVVFVSVVPVPSFVASEGEIDAAYLKEEENEFQSLHNKLIDSYFKPNSGLLIESKILHGNPANKILKYADDMNADLIVIGSKGQGRLASIFLGNTSNYIAHHSKRSVIIVKKKE